jgi:anti-sigma regulatory factor (Ser/Thr protein kinase)
MSATCTERSEIRQLVRNVHAPYAARVFIAWQLGEWRLGRLIDTAQIVASELVTNAVRHGRGDEIEVCLVKSGGSVTVRVWDANPEMPRMHEPVTALGESGRGLTLVAAICADWGCYHLERAAKSSKPALPESIQQEGGEGGNSLSPSAQTMGLKEFIPRCQPAHASPARQ